MNKCHGYTLVKLIVIAMFCYLALGICIVGGIGYFAYSDPLINSHLHCEG